MLCLSHSPLGHAFLSADTSLAPATLDIVSTDNLTLLAPADSTAFTTDIATIVNGAPSGDFINHVSLVFAPYSLLPGNVYRFQLLATGENGHQGEAVIDIETESTPSSGYLLVQPNTGMAIHTTFSLQAKSWTDAVGDTPLKYRFGFFPNSSLDDIVWLSGIGPSNELTTRLPSLSATQSIKLALQVFDVNSAATIHSHTLKFETHLSPDIDLNEVYEGIYTDSIIRGQWMNGLASAMSVMYAMNRAGVESFTDPSAEQDFRRMVTAMAIQVLKYHIPPEKSLYLMVANLLKEASEDAQYSPTELLSLLQAINDIVHMLAYEESWKGSTIGNGIAKSDASAILSLYSNLIKHHSQPSLGGGIGGRIREDSIIRSFLDIIPSLSYGMCQQLGSYESSDPVSDPVLGSLRVSRIPPLNNQTVIEPEELQSSFPASFVDFGQSVFKHFLQLATVLNDNEIFEGICFTMMQSANDIHWQGSLYQHHIKSTIVSLLPMNSNSGDVITLDSLNDPIKLTLPLIRDPSPLGTLECAFWDEASLEWSNEGCSTISVSTHPNTS